MKKITLTGLLLLPSFLCLSQAAYTYIDVNKLKGRVNADGSLFNDYTGLTEGLEAPIGSGSYAIFGSNLWIGGIDETNEQRVAANTYHIRGTDFWPGPIKDDGTAADSAEWSKVWVMTKAMVDLHKTNYSNGSYVMPDEIKNWPVNLGSEYSSTYANFKDLNNNGIYEPGQGEYPLISGDKEIYFIFNDLYSAHTETTSAKPMGLEIKGKIYGYSSTVLQNVLFVKYVITNRSANNYRDVLAGIWTDFDIGNPYNDYVGTHLSRNMYFGYNGQPYDSIYPDGPPAMGVLFLNKPLTFTQHYEANTQTGNGEPTNANHYYRLLKSTQRNGLQLPLFSFNGNPCDGTGDNETDPSGDRRMVGSTGPFKLNAGQSVELEIAYIFYQSTNAKQSVCAIFDIADEVTTLYKLGEVTGINNISSKQVYINAYPNPTSKGTTISFNKIQGEVDLKIYSSVGKECISVEKLTKGYYELTEGTLPKGIYYVQINGPGIYKPQTLKLIIT